MRKYCDLKNRSPYFDRSARFQHHEFETVGFGMSLCMYVMYACMDEWMEGFMNAGID
jgi:hypothetical protein